MKCPLASTNKRFLINTIKNTLPSHKEQDHEQKEGTKEAAKSQDQKDVNPKKQRSHPYKRSLRARGSVGYSPPRKRGTRDKSDPRPSRHWGHHAQTGTSAQRRAGRVDTWERFPQSWSLQWLVVTRQWLSAVHRSKHAETCSEQVLASVRSFSSVVCTRVVFILVFVEVVLNLEFKLFKLLKLVPVFWCATICLFLK